VKRYILEQNQFVCAIYKKMIDEKAATQSEGSISAKANI
jgi:hypothetical protein